jgi:GNAT superfamily N-acetyltransferase
VSRLQPEASLGSSPEEAARTAAEPDIPHVVALADAATEEKLRQKGGALWARREGRPTPREAGLRLALGSPEHEVAVGTLDGTVVGYGVARVEPLLDGGLLGVIDDIYVEPGARAVGVGESLMNHLLGWCTARGCFGVDSLALPGDRETKNFFESFGLVARAIVVHRPLS